MSLIIVIIITVGYVRKLLFAQVSTILVRGGGVRTDEVDCL